MYWKQWKAAREAKLKILKNRAEGYADLKPRHINRAIKIYKQEFYNSLDKTPTLNIIFDVEYGEALDISKNHENLLLKLIRTDHKFVGDSFSSPIILGKDYGVRK